MTTTSKGIPLYDLTDDADLATKLDAIASATDDLLTVASRQMARTNTLTLSTFTWTAVDGYNIGSTWNEPASGGITYPGSGVLQVTDDGLYDWEHVWSYPLSAGNAMLHAAKLQVNGADPTYSQGFWAVWEPAGSGSFPRTAGGKVPLSAGDQIQVFLLQSGTGVSQTVNPMATTITRAAIPA